MIPGESKITDIIHLNHEQDKALIDLWEKNLNVRRTEKGIPISSDLFFSKTLPLHNFEVVIDERDELDDGKINIAFFYVMDETLNGIPITIHPAEGMREIKYVMNLFFTETKCPTVFLARMGIEDGNDHLFAFEFCAYKGDQKRHLTLDEVQHFCLDRLLGGFLETWYGIEVAMLHPTVKELFVHPKVRKEKISKKNRAEYGHKVYRYVKHHYITDDDLNDAIYGKESHPFNRKALIWYVSGHWREYKTGKKVFIQPYWKGALRATKKAEPRNREIVIEKEVTT